MGKHIKCRVSLEEFDKEGKSLEPLFVLNLAIVCFLVYLLMVALTSCRSTKCGHSEWREYKVYSFPKGAKSNV